MLKKLKRHLIFLFTGFSSLILTVVIIGALFINLKQSKQHSIEHYQTVSEEIKYKLQNDSLVTNTWLSQLEVKYHLIIHIEQNGIPFFFRGAWNPFTNIPDNTNIQDLRKEVIQSVIGLAKKEKIVYNTDEQYSTLLSSSIYSIHPRYASVAYASVTIIPTKKDTLVLTLIQFRTNETQEKLLMVLLFVGIALVGYLLLFHISCYLVNKAMLPVIQNEQKQNEFIAAASHDLRSPLAIIQTNASALLIDGVDSSKFVPKIIEECTYMSRLISDLLILASSDASTWHIEKEPTDAEPYLIDLFDTFFQVCQKREHMLSLDLPDDELPTIYVDRGRLTQVLGILIDNALSYSPIHTTITIKPYMSHHHFYLAVIDQGVGIPDEQKDTIFERFYRTDASRHDSSHFGLGLSVAKELMNLQGGSIHVQDTKTHGATFILKLPLSQSN